MKKIYLILTIGLSFLVQTTFADPPLPTPIGRVVWVQGTLQAAMENKETRQLQKSSIIYLHDILKTNANSQAQLIFTDNTLMTLREKTELNLQDYKYRPKAKGKSIGKYVMQLITGGFRTITGLIAKNNPNEYRVNTPVATIGVRGTDYTINFDGTELLIGSYEGVPCVDNKKGSLCLEGKNRFSKVLQDSAPQVLASEPQIFQNKLRIDAAKISPFTGGYAGQTEPRPAPAGGTVSSFCIQ